MASKFDAFYNPISLDNGFTMRDAYPTAMGASTGEIATGAGPSWSPGSNRGVSMAASTVQTDDSEIAQATALGGQVNPLIGGIVFIALVLVTMFVARKLGTDDGDFKNLKPSIYNVLTVGLCAAASLPLLKFAAVKLKVPGVTNWILAA